MKWTIRLFVPLVFFFFLSSPGWPAQAAPDPHKADRLVDLNACIDYLEKTGNLVRVKSEVDPVHELAGIAKKFEGKKCVLFEKVKGSAFPVFMGLLWNRDTVGSLFNVPKEKVPFVIGQAIGAWRKDKEALPSKVLDKGPANEVVVTKGVNLYDLPAPVHALQDGGPYFDSSVVVVNDPATGKPNISIHRIMITGKDRLTFLIDPGRHLGAYLETMEKQGKPLQVTINNGVGLAPWLVSSVPGTGPGKATIASHIVGRPIHFIKAQTVDVPAFADAQFVIEAEIIPHVRETEGPFAEVTGYYGKQDKRWVMRVKAITHRKNPVFHSLLSGQEVWNAVGFTAEAKIFVTVKQKVPDLKAVYLPPGGCGFYGAVLQLTKSREGIQNEAIQEAFKAFPSLQWVVAVDDDVNIYDPIDVEWAITTRFNAKKGFIVLKDQPGHILNPMVEDGLVTKVGVDATAPYPRTSSFERVKFKDVDLGKFVIQ
ncbi:UbiD family decarboxylase [Syntrophus sp. (in: bacteria)]|jgi:2,5-furandicarboxylate decarboxylase 1|uniref:UbiD family decarboxylase n=1 Tax=Syntrophus sp. (in: bacteria) TaxID=48412 RepID=UPI00345E728A